MFVTVRSHRSAQGATVAANPYESVGHLARRAARFWFQHVDHTRDLFSLQCPTTGHVLQEDRSLKDAGVADGSQWELTITTRDV